MEKDTAYSQAKKLENEYLIPNKALRIVIESTVSYNWMRKRWTFMYFLHSFGYLVWSYYEKYDVCEYFWGAVNHV